VLGSQLLQGLKVLDLAGEPLSMTGRMLADMGAEVVKLESTEGDPLRTVFPAEEKSGTSLRFLAWNAGKTSVKYTDNDPRIDALLSNADVIIQTPGFSESLQLDVASAPQAVWLIATPFGLQGPRGKWRASDLGIMAASGNMNATGYADRPPLRCSEPAAYAHASAEAAFAILTALASGHPQVIDLSMQEAVMIASMSAAGQLPKTGNKGRRQGASLGKTREIWPCKDGFVSFGLRGGPARVRNFKILQQQLAQDELLTAAWAERDWNNFNPQLLEDDVLRAIEEPLAAYFARHTMTELYALAVETNLMLAPANSAEGILGSEQLAARNMFVPVGGIEQFPARFFIARGPQNLDMPPTAPRCAPKLHQGPWPAWGDQCDAPVPKTHDTPVNHACWEGLKLVEFGSGAAGPIACRYFIEHGATVIRIESKSHPDFLRVMSASSPQGLEGSTLFDALNVGKQSVTVNLKHPDGKQIARQLMLWADAVLENFAPKAMKSYGLDYEQVVREKPDLLMLSTCLNGQTGPHKNYPGFGGQGAALSGFNFLTGWPDREPIGPFGTITDSLAPRFAASALAAALLYRRRTGRGLHLDLSQVETGAYSLSPWLLEYAVTGHCSSRDGNRSPRAVPHGVFPCQGDNRWIAIACWNDHEWVQLAAVLGLDAQRYPDIGNRLANQDEIEKIMSDITSQREAHTLARQLQYAGIEAVPVADFEDLLTSDPQLKFREHFVPIERALTGESIYERNGFRLSNASSGFERPSPLLGEQTDDVLINILGYDAAKISQLRESGAID
jgi:crotonobetainyl-CoA:carnitine CoA-transferase CaiB-like acyl-CoA transferase